MKVLINYLEENIGDSLKLYVINLFKICWNFCILRKEDYFFWVKYDDYKVSYNGLRELMWYKCCEIKVYIKKDWLELLNIVFVFVVEEIKDFIDNYCNKIGKNDRSREEEDIFI